MFECPDKYIQLCRQYGAMSWTFSRPSAVIILRYREITNFNHESFRAY